MKETRRDMREGAARMDVGDMHRACNLGFRPRDDRDRACLDRGGNEILAVEFLADEGAEDRPRRDFAMIDREPGHHRAFACRAMIAEQRGEAHYSVSPSLRTSGISSDTSTSRLSSGNTPSIGPARITTFLITGAAV